MKQYNSNWTNFDVSLSKKEDDSVLEKKHASLADAVNTLMDNGDSEQIKSINLGPSNAP